MRFGPRPKTEAGRAARTEAAREAARKAAESRGYYGYIAPPTARSKGEARERTERHLQHKQDNLSNLYERSRQQIEQKKNPHINQYTATCRFFSTRSGCARGEACHFLHQDAALGQQIKEGKAEVRSIQYHVSRLRAPNKPWVDRYVDSDFTHHPIYARAEPSGWGRDNDAEDSALVSQDLKRAERQERADLELRQERQEQKTEREIRYPYPTLRAIADTYGDDAADAALEEAMYQL